MAPRWTSDSVKVVRAEVLRDAVGGSAARGRATAFEFAGSGGKQTWIGVVRLSGGANTGPHHHGHHEVAIWVIGGRSEIRWGDRLEFATEVGPGDFAYFAPNVPHQERNLERDTPVDFAVIRSNGDAIRFDLPIVPMAEPATRVI
jgi:uncharacterized RmlC-like cupin family protein